MKVDSCGRHHRAPGGEWRAASSPQDARWGPVSTVTHPAPYWHLLTCPGHSRSALPEGNVDEFLTETGFFPTA